MKTFLYIWLLVLMPTSAFATCMEVDNSYEARLGGTGGCPPGYAPLNQQTLDQTQQDTNNLNALAAQGQADQQRNADQVTANQIAAGWQQMKPTCDFVENHPAEARLKAIADGKPPSNVQMVVEKCQQMQAIVAQAEQAEQREGITPDATQGNNQ